MKLNTIDGKELDTDKMSDMESELIEKAKELSDLCIKYNTSFLLCMNYNEDICSGAHNFVDFKGFGRVAMHIDSIFRNLSKNNIGICNLEVKENQEESTTKEDPEGPV